MITAKNLLANLRGKVQEITPDAVREKLQNGIRIIDVREAEEFKQGHLPGATFIPRGFLELRIEDAVPDRNQEVILYCAGGSRSLFAAHNLQELGYNNVRSMYGGFQKWKESGFQIEIPEMLSDPQRQRYQRHLIIPEIGEKGQLKLLKSKVLLIGAGGLGCPAALYLAAAGVGTLGIVDDDRVDESNLQRQVLHAASSVGRLKVESAKEALLAQNPSIQIRTYAERITAANAAEILHDYDLVIDGTDNFVTRYLMNDACVLLKKPNVYGSVFRFEGQVSLFVPGEGPCYRCLYPEPTPSELAPSCAEAGVLGILPGIIGLLQATEAIKWLTGIGSPLIGRLLWYDALQSTVRTFKLHKNPKCPACGEQATIKQLQDLEWSCQMSAGFQPA
jgi:molybdopterin/thiamine biosynthesis adenylyltransferase/rhodanese-related sulfurtransferase